MNYINPDSGKIVNSEKRAFKKILEKFNAVDGLLEPKNKTGYGYSEKLKRWVKTNAKINKIYQKKNDVLKLKDDLVYGIKGRLIKKSGKVYKHLENIGYVFDPDNQKLYKQSNKTYIKPDLKEAIKIVETQEPYKIIFSNEQQTLYYTYSTLTNFVEYFKRVNYPDMMDMTLVFKNDYSKFGPAYNSSNGKNCVINVVENHYNNHNYKLSKGITWDDLYNKYNDGFLSSDFQDLANDLKFNIIVDDGINIYTYTQTRKDKRQLKLTYSNNHVEVSTIKNIKQLETVKLNNMCCCIENITFGTEMDHKCEQLTDIIKTINHDDIKNVIIQNNKFIGIITDDKIYKNSYDIIKLENDFSYMGYLNKNIHNYFTNEVSNITSEEDILKQFCSNAIFYNTGTAINPYKIDLDGAYSNFGELPTDLIYKVNTTEFIDKMGISYITHTDPLTNITSTNWRGNNYIKDGLIKYNIPFTITQAMISSNSTKLNLKDFYKDNKKIYECDKRIFHKILGKWQVYEFAETATTTDTSIANKYGGFEVDNSGIYIYDKKQYKSNKNFYPHIVGYIHEYTNIKLMDLIMSKNLKPVRVWVDAIELEKEEVNKFTNWKLQRAREGLQNGRHESSDSVPSHTKNKNDRFECNIKGFHIEQSKPFNDIIIDKNNHKESSETIDLLITKDNPNGYLELPKEKISVVAGAGGCGKSHYIKQLSKVYKTTILTPTHMVGIQFEKYNTISSTLYSENPINKVKLNEILLIDEYSMVSNEDFEKILDKSKFTKIILFGDLVQLPVIKGTQITKYPIKVLTKNYRAKDDPEFIKYLLNTRETGNIDYIKKRVDTKEAIINDMVILSTTNNEIKRINKLGLELNTNKQIPDSILKVKTPVYIKTRKNELRKKYNLVNSQCGLITDFNDKYIILNVNDKIVNLPIEKKNFLYPAYSLTYHKVQGLTIDKKLVLNLHKINFLGEEYILNLKYVGVSRVRKLEQLHILSDSGIDDNDDIDNDYYEDLEYYSDSEE